MRLMLARVSDFPIACCKRLAAAARVFRVRVVEYELRSKIVLDEVHRGSNDVHHRRRLYEHADPVLVDFLV
eukprot:CAMPEP_0184378890 /NCGR_PEP_ID=MMETSP0007-20130409/3427_1 /TAXON_ID=97485 /ORGANISM="Prymnesium parvum, Strain Texoma1" /LENGTH=70 /DNA_ID=CAMNT_0026723341 /DNA_START=403 /DNA_END=615 /DNA_ORIENTATION=+